MEGLSVIATPEEKMLFYSQKALPASIAEISRNHENLTPVIEWLENSYLTSDNQASTQLARENEAKMYLTDALGAVVENINVIASQLDDLVNLQVDAVDGLTTQIQQIKTRLQVSKDQHGANRLRTLRTPLPPPPGEFVRKISVESGILPTPGVRMESIQSLYATPSTETFQRVPLQARMSKYDNCGICLQREVDPNNNSLNSTVYENSRRKSVPGAPFTAPSSHNSLPHGGAQTGDNPPSSPSNQSPTLPVPVSPDNPSGGAPPPLAARPPPKLSTVTGPPPPLSRRVTGSSSGGG